MLRDKHKGVFDFLKNRSCKGDSSLKSQRSSREGEPSVTEEPRVGVPKEVRSKRNLERKESGRFYSAARLLRSFGKNKDEEATRARNKIDEENVNLDRSNPQYHSEGKGLRKKTSERSLNAPTNKERSKSFCDQPEGNRRVPLQEKSSPFGTDAVELSFFSRRTQNATSFEENTILEEFVSSPPTAKAKTESPNHLYNNVSPFKEQLKDFPPPVEGFAKNELVINSYQSLTLERDKDRRSLRKLTKDSGYETSPYSEGDYANFDTSELEALAAEVARENDDVTIRADSDLSSLETLIPQHSRSGSSSGEPQRQTNRDGCKPPGSPSVDLDHCSEEVSSVSPTSPSTITAVDSNPAPSSSRTPSPTKRRVSTDSPSNFDELDGSSSPSSALLSAKSTPVLCRNASLAEEVLSPISNNALSSSLQASKSTPNLEDAGDETMVTKPSAMHSYLQNSSKKANSNCNGANPNHKYWEGSQHVKGFNQKDYAHHIRSSSYQLLHNRQMSASGPYHQRQHSNSSNYSEEDDCSPKSSETHIRRPLFSLERNRCFSFDNVGAETNNSNQHTPWNSSEPDLSFKPYLSSYNGYSFSPKEISETCPTSPSLSSSRSRISSGGKVPSSPPAPPVRDASSLKYIRYGPGHEKFPSWPVPAGSASQVIPQAQSPHGANVAGLPDSASYLSTPQGSHRSHSWTEQSEYPKDNSGGYARPKKHTSPSHKPLLTVVEKCDKLSPEMYNPRFSDDYLQSPDYSLLENYFNHPPAYYPPFDREGRGIGDKDYSIPSPPERDPGMGEANLSQVTAAQLEEHTRQYDFGYGEFPQITPLLDQLRKESYMWDGGSEKDSGRGESESVADSSRYSNGRESVTTVVTNSSSASSSETLKWHGSLSDISILSGMSRDARHDHNIAHSSRVLAPQRHNSESVLYYNAEGKKVPIVKSPDSRLHREGSRLGNGTEGARYFKDAKWNKEVERKNELNNLKKFPSYSYTQPLSQINEAPAAESHEAMHSVALHSTNSPTVDLSKPPSVAERIHELERQSRPTINESTARWPRDLSEPRDTRRQRADHRREPSLGRELMYRKEMRRNSSEKDLNMSNIELPVNLNLANPRSPTLSSTKSFRTSASNLPTSPRRRDSNESIISMDSTHSHANSLNGVERPNISRSYTYLDPEKKCMVPDSTLKSIQKQAILSFYERRTGKNATNTSHNPDTSPLVINGTPPQNGEKLHSKWSGQSLRGRLGSKLGKGIAKLGRIPDGEVDQKPLKPVRRRSVSGRETSKEGPKGEDPSSRNFLLTNSTQTRTEPPAVPVKSQQGLANTNHNSSPFCTQFEKENKENEESEYTKEEESLHPTVRRACHDISLLSASESSVSLHNSSLSSPPVTPKPSSHATNNETPPALPPPPVDETPPKPPDRPPKRPNLRSLFHSTDRGSPSLPTVNQDKGSPENVEIRRIEESANELRNLSPSKPYFYKKPPAPDPPVSPSSSPPTIPRSPAIIERRLPILFESAVVPHMSRCSTPELPPPPPPPPVIEEVIAFDEPLPPPPLEVSPDNCSAEALQNSSSDETYHKDSYIANRRDWKTGFEGSYRRTHSPSAPQHRNPLLPARTRDRLNNNVRNGSSKLQTTGQTNQGIIRSAVSTSNINHSPASLLDDSINNNHNNSFNCGNNSSTIANYNGWSAHPRQASTTVNFTAEELKAFHARRAAPDTFKSGDREFLHKNTINSNPRDTVGGSMCSLSTEGSSSSSTAYSDTSPSHLGSSWTTSLDCLHRTAEAQNPMNSTPGRGISRAISVGEPLHRVVDRPHETLTATAIISSEESLSISTNTAESLALSPSAEVISNSNSISREPLSSPSYSVDSTHLSSEAISHDGPITAHPATVTEECNYSSSPNTPESTAPSSPKNNGQIYDLSSSFLASSPPILQLSSTLPTTPLSENFISSQSTVLPVGTSTTSSVSIHHLPSVDNDKSTSTIRSTSSSSTLVSSASSSSSILNTTTTVSPVRPSYLRSLSAIGTSASMASVDLPPDADVDRSKVVILGYGRTRCKEEIDCDHLSHEFAQRLATEKNLQALLAPSSSYKTTANYMEGVFTLELRSDLLCSCHADHPDLRRSSKLQDSNSSSTEKMLNDSILVNGFRQESERLGLDDSDSTCSMSEDRMKSHVRREPFCNVLATPNWDSAQLMKKKDELTSSISRKLTILRSEQALIQCEVSSNNDLGQEVIARLEGKAKPTECDKIKIHVEEIDKITSLLLGLCGRLAKAENALLNGRPTQQERLNLESKRDKLMEQLEEAKKLKDCIDRRAVQVSGTLNKYLASEEYAEFDHFIKMKAKLIMDGREVEDKIRLCDEQQDALKALPNL